MDTEFVPDTLWASGYELYDRLSPPYQKFFESLTATYAQPGFAEVFCQILWSNGMSIR